MAIRLTATGLHHEVRGSGPALLMIPGATGDGGHFARAAERLADEFTVITYDRRGNSRSHVSGDPAQVATMAAQADDAAALVKECGFESALVFGTSGGAVITLELLVRHPAVVRGAVLHEPPLISLLDLQGPSPLEPIFELARTDPRRAVELFVRANSSDSAWDAIEPAARERMQGNGTTLFAHEIGNFLTYLPEEDRLKSAGKPVVLLHSREGLEFAPAIEGWLEGVFGVKGGVLTGHHAPYFDMPEVFAEELRPLLRSLA